MAKRKLSLFAREEKMAELGRISIKEGGRTRARIRRGRGDL